MQKENSTTTQVKKIGIGSLQISKKPLVWIIVLFLMIPVGFYIYQYSFLTPRNYAQEVVQPLEDAFVEVGAAKKCGWGNNGKTIDNREPWYTIHFETSLDRAEAETLLTRLGQSNGFQFSKDSRANTYTAKVKPHYSDLEEGEAEINATFSSKSAQIASYACFDKSTQLNGDESHTLINIEVRLPSFKCGGIITCNALPW